MRSTHPSCFTLSVKLTFFFGATLQIANMHTRTALLLLKRVCQVNMPFYPVKQVPRSIQGCTAQKIQGFSKKEKISRTLKGLKNAFFKFMNLQEPVRNVAADQKT